MNNTPKIAVLVHIFYPDMWEILTNYLDNLSDFEYDLYVNLVDNFHNDQDIERIKKYKSTVKIKISKNKGVDIGGFLSLYEDLEKDYDLILKIHTKKSLGLTNKPSDYVRVYGYETAEKKGKEWFIRLMDGVLRDKVQVKNIVDLLTLNTPCGMVGLDCETYVGPNNNHLDDIAKNFNIPLVLNGDRLKNGSFVGGTIFWVRNDILKKYLNKKNIDYIFSKLPDGYQNEPSYNHAMERLFGLMVYNENMKIINI